MRIWNYKKHKWNKISYGNNKLRIEIIITISLNYVSNIIINEIKNLAKKQQNKIILKQILQLDVNLHIF